MFKQISILLLICFSGLCALAQTQQTEKPLQGLAILSKPRPNYTDEARKKGVEGTVTLKITFLANGEIGDVIYVSENSKKKKLTKYGLVNQAIEAAKKIKFEPAKKNGQPLTSIAAIEYSFMLY